MLSLLQGVSIAFLISLLITIYAGATNKPLKIHRILAGITLLLALIQIVIIYLF